MAADVVEEEIQDLLPGGERRGSCASQSDGCCFDPAMVEQIFTFGAAHAEQNIQALREEWIRRFKVPATLVHTTGREERGGK